MFNSPAWTPSVVVTPSAEWRYAKMATGPPSAHPSPTCPSTGPPVRGFPPPQALQTCVTILTETLTATASILAQRKSTQFQNKKLSPPPQSPVRALSEPCQSPARIPLVSPHQIHHSRVSRYKKIRNLQTLKSQKFKKTRLSPKVARFLLS